jgi:hypothetical protein
MIEEINGEQIEVEEIEVLTAKEPWSTYALADGSNLLIKNVLIKVTKSTTAKGADGLPLYFTRVQTISKIS